jgi:hypothetical protein
MLHISEINILFTYVCVLFENFATMKKLTLFSFSVRTLFLIPSTFYFLFREKGESKAIPLQAWRVPEGSGRLKL